MSVQELKEKLHQYIEVADEQHLSAIYTLVGDYSGAQDANDDYIFDDITVQMLNERVEKYERGESKVYTAEESINALRQHLNNNGI